MFENPAGLFALLALPAIAALHLFRRKFQRRVVSALFLWQDEVRTPVAGRKRERLPKSLSLACELSAAACLALALSGPRGCAREDAEHLVVLVDGSASMGAVGADGRSVLEVARERIAERVRALPSGSRVTVVRSGARPDVIVGPGAYPAEALAKLDAYEPTALHHDLASGIALAEKIALSGRIVCFTDRLDAGALPEGVEVHALGTPLDNVAIVHATRRRASEAGSGEERIEIVLQSFARTPRDVRVSAVLPLSGDRPVLEPHTVALAPGERKTTRFPVADGGAPVEVRIEHDALAIDDRAWLAPLPRRTVRLGAALSADNARLLGLGSGARGPVGRWLGLVDDAIEAADQESAHVLVTDRPAGGPTTWKLALAPLGGERKDFIGPFLADERHPLTAGTTLEGLVWSTDPSVALEGSPLVSAGNLPILTEQKLPGARVYTLAFDPARSSLQRSLDWPILLSNLVEMRRAELPGPSATNLVVGDVVTWRADAYRQAELTLVGPRGKRSITEKPVLALMGFDAPGLYSLERGADVLARFGVSFSDAAESDLSLRGSGDRPSTAIAASARPETSWPRVVLVALALALLLLDWWVLGRGAGQPSPAALAEAA